MTGTSDIRHSRFLPPDTCIRPDGGGWRAWSPHPLGAHPRTLTDWFIEWARRAPERTLLAERDSQGAWRRLTYSAALDGMERIAQALLDRGLSVERPVLILSGNSIEHALLALAAMHIGVPYAPVAPAYSLASQDHNALAAVFAKVRPGLVFAADGPAFARALANMPLHDGVEIVTCTPTERPRRGTGFDELAGTATTLLVDEAHREVGPDSVAKILFTSGSTGTPKGVINTQRMLCANQEQIRSVMRFLAEEPPVLCDWLPWNHTFGGNHNFGITLCNGGTLYLDGGAPTPAGFPTTLANLRDIATTAYFNVPRGFELLLPALREDLDFSRLFFSRLRMLFYAAAGLQQEVVDAFEELAVAACGVRIPWVTGLGSTETAPLAICTGPMPVPEAGRIGVPVPGVELKAVPVGAVLEARVRGPNVTPGYWRDPELTKAAFDEEGFYAMGDAIALVDPADPSAGFAFQGRIAEDFKLSTGTWVRVGPLRAALLLHLGELAQDVVIAGHDRYDVRVLVFPNLAACRRIAGLPDSAPLAHALAHNIVMERFAAAIAAFGTEHRGSATCVTCAMLLAEPPSIDGGEITDKRSLNQKAVLRRRRALVDQLYAAAEGVRLVTEGAEERSST